MKCWSLEWPLFLSVSLFSVALSWRYGCQCGSLIFWVQWCPKEIKAVHFSFKSKDSLGGSHIPKSACESYRTDLKDVIGREKETEKRERETERDLRETEGEGPCVLYMWFRCRNGRLMGSGWGQVLLRECLWSHAGLLLKEGAAGPQLGWTPAGQLCGTAAIVEQNSFLITHLAFSV